MVMQFEERLIAYIDILGFKKMVMNAKNDQGTFDKVLNALNVLKKQKRLSDYVNRSHSISQNDIESAEKTFRFVAFSDAIFMSGTKNGLGLDFLLDRVSRVCFNLLLLGVLPRGALTIGSLYHDKDNVVFGEGLIEAHEMEKNEALYPRIIVGKNFYEFFKTIKRHYDFSEKMVSQNDKGIDDLIKDMDEHIVVNYLEKGFLVSDQVSSPRKGIRHYLDEIREKISENVVGENEKNVKEKLSRFANYFNWVANKYGAKNINREV